MDEQFENNNEEINENEDVNEALEVEAADEAETEEAVGTDKEEFNLAREILEWVYTIAVALIITFVIKGFVFDVVRVDGPSMVPTLQHNDKLIVTKLGYEPEAGDIIILDSAYKNRMEYMDSIERTTGEEMSFMDKISFKFNMPDNLKKRYYVKRVIALPGQTVDFDEDGNVLVDGEILEEEYYEGITYPMDSRVRYPVTVEENMVFVMGDNRSVSKDSRSAELGQVPYDAILGKAKFRIWPLGEFGTLD